jgi:hypothetical protein
MASERGRLRAAACPHDDELCVLPQNTPESALDKHPVVLSLVKCSDQLLGSKFPFRRRSCEGRRSRSDSVDDGAREISLDCMRLEGGALGGRLI